MTKKGSIRKKLNIAKSKVSSENIGFATLNIEYLIKLIRAKKQEKPNLSIPILLYEIEQSYKKIAFNTVDASKIVTRSDFCVLRTLMYVKAHPEVIFQTIDNSDRSELIKKKNTFKYTPNIEESVRELMQDACSSIMSRYDLDTKVRFIRGEFNFNERMAMQKEILEKIGDYQNRLEKEIKSSYVSNIVEIARVLDENGCFDKNIERYNRRMRMIGLEELQENEENKQSKITTISSMSDWKNPNMVEKLPLETLIIASAFFTNRLCKEYIAFKKSMFLLEELNISEETILKNNIAIPDSIFYALVKYEFLQSEAREKYVELQKQSLGKSNGGKIEYVPYTLDYEQQDFEEYKRRFDSVLPTAENYLESDYKGFMQYDNTMEILYHRKDIALDSLIMFLLDNKTKLNWGYIEEKTESGNSIERQKAMVALGFDLSRFNTVIRLHKSLKELKELIKEANASDVFPVYNGDEDWKVTDKFGNVVDMNTQVFRMFTNPERKKIKEKGATLSPQDRLYEFVSHLNWLANRGIPPKHKKRKIVHLNTGKVEEIEPKIKAL